MEFRFYRESEFSGLALLSVDGICPTGPNFSHWPGNRTPSELKHNLSTGILLRFATLPKKERARYLQGAELVSNNHFDTDGLLSIWTALYPEKALRYAPKLLAAAEAGDFSLAPSAQAVQFDLTVSAFADPRRSPIGIELWNLSDEDRYEKAYRALLDLLPDLFDRLEEYRPLWKEGFAQFEESHLWLRQKGKVRRYPDLDFTVVESDRPLDRRALQTVAQADRVLWVQRTPKGNLFQFWYAATSWFELVTNPKPPRIPFASLAERLNQSCPGYEGQWIGENLEKPVAFLFFGLPGERSSVDEISGTPLPNPTLTSRIEDHLLQFLRGD